MKRFKNILCIIDCNKTCNQVLERAISLAENNQANLTVATVIEPLGNSFDFFYDKKTNEIEERMKNDYENKIKELIDNLSTKIDINIKVLTGVVFLEVIYEVLRNDHDLVMKSPQKADWIDKLFGSDDMHILRKCPCPVWMIKSNTPKSYGQIVASIDVSFDDDSKKEVESLYELNKKIVQIAGSLTIAEFAELHIVHAWYAEGETIMNGPFLDMEKDEISKYIKDIKHGHSSKLAEFLTSLKSDKTGEMIEFLKPKTHLEKGTPSEVIPKFLKQVKADLIVMGTVGRTGVPGFIIGNTAENILNQIDCSVLAIKPSGFVSPVKLVEE